MAVFSTKASDLISGPASFQKLVAYNLLTNGMRLITSTYPTGAIFSANSRFVVHAQMSPSYPLYDVYRHDLRESVATNQNVLVAPNAFAPSVSADGQAIAFRSCTKPYQVYVRDLATNTVELISAAPDGFTPGNASSGDPQISPDGRFVLFSSKASNLVPNDDHGFTDVFLRDRKLGLTYLLSANPNTGRSGNGPSITPNFSADGSTIVFASLANDLTVGDFNGNRDVFVVKLTSGDSDGDGLDDAWELAFFGNLDRNGTSDFDGDGFTDLQEYRAGTDPTNQGSRLSVLAMARPGDRQTTLIWPVSKTSAYKVQYKRSVTDAEWTDLNASVTINGNTAFATDPDAGLDAARFYRIVLLP
jgi:hypothetical protein